MDKKVAYDNRLNLVSDLARLSPVEQDIAFSIFQRITEARTASLTVPASEIRLIAGLTERSNSLQYIRTLRRVADALLSMRFWYTVPDEEIHCTLFTILCIKRATGDLTIATNPTAESFFYDLRKNFSVMRLSQFTALHHKASKTLFRLLVQHFKGEWHATPDELKTLLGLDNAPLYKAFLRHLDEYIDDLRACGYFERLDYEVIKGRTRGSPVIEIYFSYKAVPTAAAEAAGQQRLALPVTDQVKVGHEEEVMGPLGLPTLKRVTETVERERKCPKCGKSTVIRCKNQKGKPYLCCKGGHYDNTVPESEKGPCNYFERIEEKPAETAPELDSLWPES